MYMYIYIQGLGRADRGCSTSNNARRPIFSKQRRKSSRFKNPQHV